MLVSNSGSASDTGASFQRTSAAFTVATGDLAGDFGEAVGLSQLRGQEAANTHLRELPLEISITIDYLCTFSAQLTPFLMRAKVIS